VTTPQEVFDPDFPNPACLAYKEGFIRGALAGGLRNLPDDVLGWAIDRAVRNQATSQNAGRVFASVYFRIQMRREPRGGYGSATAYLLAAYEKELKNGI
jgi:hypothetical protein